MRNAGKQNGWGIIVTLLLAGFLICTTQAQTLDAFSPVVNQLGSGESVVFTAIPLPDGRVLVGATGLQFTSDADVSYTNLVILGADGSVDDNFHPCVQNNGSDFNVIKCAALQTNGQIIIGGCFNTVDGKTRNCLARLNRDGTLDTTFNPGIYATSVRAIQIQPDGAMLICGTFSYKKTGAAIGPGLVRLNGDGSQDTSFSVTASGTVFMVALQNDGQILAGGTFTTFDGESRTNLVRLNTDGSIDESFQPVSIVAPSWAGVLGFGGGLLAQPDGKILLGGLFDRANGLVHTNIMRLNSNGTVDTNFSAQADSVGCWGLQTLALQADGKILIADDSYTLDGNPCRLLGRVKSDGSMDPDFSTNLFYNAFTACAPYSTTLQPDGKILVGGGFFEMDGVAVAGIGRLVNTDAALQWLDYDGTNLLWHRTGTSPEVWRASFDASTDGTNWIQLGDGTYVGGGWGLTHVSAATNAIIRARGFVTGGNGNGSSWYVDSLFALPTPKIILNNGNFGLQNQQFGFDFIASTGTTVVIDTSTNLVDWLPLGTNVLGTAQNHFIDQRPPTEACEFYRLRAQP